MGSFSEVFERLVEERGVTADQINKGCGVSKQTIIHWLRGHTAKPRVWEDVVKVASYLKLKRHELDELLLAGGGPPVEVLRQNAAYRKLLEAWLKNGVSRPDWGDAPAVERFYGREQEIGQLTKWLANETCHLVGIFAMGGMGKTMLAAKVARSLASSFEIVFWRTLRHGLPIDKFLAQAIAFLSENKERDKDSLDEQLLCLLFYLRQKRCLLILDNVETVMKSGDGAGGFRPEHQQYADLIEAIGNTSHQSCLLLTSREHPIVFAKLPGALSLHLPGVTSDEAQHILADKPLVGTTNEWQSFVSRYSGNPLALQLATQAILEHGQDKLGPFLGSAIGITGDIEDVLDQHFARISPLQQELLVWLAIEREEVSPNQLRKNLIRPPRLNVIENNLGELHRRYLVQAKEGFYTLQNVIAEYLVNRLVTSAITEIDKQSPNWLNQYALVKPTSKEYIREMQKRVILRPITNQLLDLYGSLAEILATLKEIVNKLRAQKQNEENYFVSNLIQIVDGLGQPLNDWDFGRLTILRGDFRYKQWHKTNLAHATLKECIFTQPLGHTDSLAFSPDGQLLAIATDGGKISVFQMPSMQLRHLFHVDLLGDDIYCFAFSPNQRFLAAAGMSFVTYLWDLETERLIAVLHGHQDWIWSIFFTMDGQFLISCSFDKSVIIWQLSTGQKINSFQTPSPIHHAAFIQNKILATAHRDGIIRLWSLDGVEIAQLVGHVGVVWAVAATLTGDLLASAGDDGAIRFWSLVNYCCETVIQASQEQIRWLAFHPSGQWLVSLNQGGALEVWQVKTQTLRYQIKMFSISRLAFSENFLASGSRTTKIYIWQWQKDQPRLLHILDHYRDEVRGLCLAPNGTRVISCGDLGILRVWEVMTGNLLGSYQKHKFNTRAMALDPLGRYIATGGEDKSAYLWDVQTYEAQLICDHYGWIWAVAFNPSGTLLAIAGYLGEVKLYDLWQKAWYLTLKGFSSWIWALTFCSNQTVAVGCEDGSVQQWDISSKRAIQNYQGAQTRIRGLACSAKSNWLIGGGYDPYLYVWDLATGQLLHQLAGYKATINKVEISPDDQWVVSGDDEGDFRVWNTTAWQCEQVVKAHTLGIDALALSKDGRLLATGGIEGTIRIWETNSWQCIQTLIPPRPYEGMNITGVAGLTSGEKSALLELGAIESKDD